jgi:mRNA-degrading endonuclease YafQ of YafQ-DinJ toxin-antitoxin module
MDTRSATIKEGDSNHQLLKWWDDYKSCHLQPTQFPAN